MRYLFALLAYLIAAAFFPTLMGLAGLLVVIAMLTYWIYRLVVPPVDEPGRNVTSTEQPAPVTAVPTESDLPFEPVEQTEPFETDEEFLARMRAQNH